MTRWTTFAGIAGVVVTLFLLLARATASGGSVDVDRPEHDHAERWDDPLDLSPGLLLANVVVSQGLFGGLVLAAAWFTAVPASAFGVTAAPTSTGLPALLAGVALGVALVGGNELAQLVADVVGIGYSESLREAITPESRWGWVVLLGAVLPLVALVEEFLFRATLVGAFHAGFGLSPWLLAVSASVVFALGHGMQGSGGMLVAGLLGLALAAGFVLTGSLLTVVVAHYLVNAAEFLRHERPGRAGGGAVAAGDEGDEPVTSDRHRE